MHIKSSFCKMIRGGQGVDNTDKISSYPNSSQIEGKPDLDTIQIKEADLGHEIVLKVTLLQQTGSRAKFFQENNF